MAFNNKKLSNKFHRYQQTPPPLPPYTGGGVITKRFPLLCKEGLGEVVIKNRLVRQSYKQKRYNQSIYNFRYTF